MSDTWVPKVGDRVMVGEHGPYEVVGSHVGYMATLRVTGLDAQAPVAWLTPAPAPEPEPEEPTAPGALVRSSQGILLFRSTGDASRWYEVMTPGGGYWEWDEIPRPVIVVLADPAEVEQLRAESTWLRERVEEERTLGLDMKRRADELQRRIDKALDLTDEAWFTKARSALRGES